MRLVGALAAGLLGFLVVALATGHADDLRVRLPGPRRAGVSRAVWLRQAGLRVTPAQFRVVSAALGLLVVLACASVTRSLVASLVPGIVAAIGPHAYYSRNRNRRLGAVVRSWPDGIHHVLGTVSAGRSIHQALLELARSGPAPLREAFAHYGDLAATADTAAALRQIGYELADPMSDRVLLMLTVADRYGQALALQVLREQAVQITEDLRTAQEIRTALIEPRMSAWWAFAIPWAALLLLTWTTPEYRAHYQTGDGLLAVAAAALIGGVAMVVGERMTRAQAEPRVLAVNR